MVSSHFRAMPNALAKNRLAQAGLLLIIIAGGMLFFAGEEINQLIKTWFEMQGINGPGAIAAMLVIAIILATSGYYLMKNLKGR